MHPNWFSFRRVAMGVVGDCCTDGTDQHITADEIEEHVLEAPAGWLLSVRDIQPVSSVQLEWEVEVATIRQAARNSASQKQTNFQWSPTSCLEGVKWSMRLRFEWDASKQGVRIGLYVYPTYGMIPRTSQLAHFVAARSSWSVLGQIQCAKARLHGGSSQMLAGAAATFQELSTCVRAVMRVPGLPRPCQHQTAFCCG